MSAVMMRLADGVADVATVLDIGCGAGVYLSRLVATHSIVGLDASAERLGRLAPGIGRLLGRAEQILPRLAARSFGAVTALDAIEHFTTEDGLLVLEHMKRLARRRVLVFTPSGTTQCSSDDLLLCHRSGWDTAALEALGFQCEVWPKFDYGPPVGWHDGLWATWER